MKSTAARYIDATEETTAKLAKVFNVTEKYIYMCLTYRPNTRNTTGNKIRFTAVHNYGAIPMLHVPECETMHIVTEDRRQLMRQTFDNGVTLNVDKQTGEAWAVNRHGDEVLRSQIVQFTELSKIQAEAENL